MINLINADRVLKQLYLSMVEELNKVKEQPKEIEQKEQKENEEISEVIN